MELSDNNPKLRMNLPSGDKQADRMPRSLEDSIAEELGQIDDAESQMRKALGLLGDPSRNRFDGDRGDAAARSGEQRFNGGLHRRRFVQDGDVPVTVLRREPGQEVIPHRSSGSVPPPTTSRMQRIEAALASEMLARKKAERTLGETQTALRDLQTKIGHAELGKVEAIEALRREREAVAHIRAGHDEHVARLQEALERAQVAEEAVQGYEEQLSEERSARRAAEKALRAAEADRDVAQRLVRTLSSQAESVPPVTVPAPVADKARVAAAKPPQPVAKVKPAPTPTVSPAVARRKVEAKGEAEPVKWWLAPKPASKQR